MNLIAFPILTIPADDRGMSWLEMAQSGGIVGYIIMGLSIVSMALICLHFVQIRRGALLPANQIERLDGMLSSGDVTSAVEFCLNPEHDSFLTRILGQGLTRYQRSAFGAFEIKNAIEEATDDQTARLFRSTDGLGVIGAISPLLGLLGTVLGMVGAFDSLSRSAGSNHEALAANISLALVTTLMGLILAIPCIALFTFFRNRIDSFSSEASVEIERLTLHLESEHGGAGRPSGPPRSSARPSPVPQPTARPTGNGGDA